MNLVQVVVLFLDDKNRTIKHLWNAVILDIFVFRCLLRKCLGDCYFSAIAITATSCYNFFSYKLLQLLFIHYLEWKRISLIMFERNYLNAMTSHPTYCFLLWNIVIQKSIYIYRSYAYKKSPLLAQGKKSMEANNHSLKTEEPQH